MSKSNDKDQLKKVLIIVYSDIMRDARVLKQVAKYKEHNLTLLSFGQLAEKGVEHISIIDKYPFFYKIIGAVLLKLHLFMWYYWLLPVNRQVYHLLKDKSFDLIIANDIYTLPLAVSIKKSAKLIYDAHEYYPREHDNNKMWMFFFHHYMNYLTQRFAPQATQMLTVGYIIADEYKKNFGVEPEIVLNIPAYQEMPVNPLEEGKIKIVHHGVALEQRNLELMIDVVKELGKLYTLDLYLVEFKKPYLDKLKAYVADISNVRILPPLEQKEIVQRLNHYDIGMYFLKSKSFNDINCLPNKFFDFIQARLAVVIGPSPEMKRMVEKYQCGIATRSFDTEEIIKEIRKLTPEEIYKMKGRAQLASIGDSSSH
ncbi:MAG: glycosyltransferase [Candidatus Cloacimonadales bacterium]|jgi:hypothetical protein|nr:glycosyltransferase [Candidatus Cloacimonadales bacterium]